MSERTKGLNACKIIFFIIHIVLLFGPFIYFVPQAFILAQEGEKLALTLGIITCLILSLIALISDAKTKGGLARSIIWLFILVITMCLSEIKIFIYVMSIASLVDELLIYKIYTIVKSKYQINKEIDKRIMYYHE